MSFQVQYYATGWHHATGPSPVQLLEPYRERLMGVVRENRSMVDYKSSWLVGITEKRSKKSGEALRAFWEGKEK